MIFTRPNRVEHQFTVCKRRVPLDLVLDSLPSGLKVDITVGARIATSKSQPRAPVAMVVS